MVPRVYESGNNSSVAKAKRMTQKEYIDPRNIATACLKARTIWREREIKTERQRENHSYRAVESIVAMASALLESKENLQVHSYQDSQ